MAGTRDRHGRLHERARAAAEHDRSNTALAAYVRGAQARGYSARTALATYRAAGGRVRTAAFYELWREAA